MIYELSQTFMFDAAHHERLQAALDETFSESGAWVLGSDGVYVRNQYGRPALR